MAVFPYTILPSTNHQSIYKPLINVQLNYKKTHKITLPVKALIDSGADVCFCNDMIGSWLGISLDKIKADTNFTAANGQKFSTKSEIITLKVSGQSYDCKFYFTDVLPRHTPIILGQIGFFDHFKITFDVKTKMIEVI